MMYLEVANPLLGLTKGSALLAMIQVALVPLLTLVPQVSGRNIWLFLLIDAEERMHGEPFVFYLLTVYFVIEVVRWVQVPTRPTAPTRYPYYILSIFDTDLGVLTWLR